MAFPPDQQRRLLDLQALDSRNDLLVRRLAAHPGRARLEELSARLAEVGEALDASEVEVARLDSEVRAAERQADDLRSRRERDRRRLDAGSVSSPRELEQLQHEMATLLARLTEVEDAELEVMEAAEQVRAGADEHRQALAALDEQRASAEAELAAEEAQVSAERAEIAEQRTRLVADVDDALLARYEQSRSRHAGVGAAALKAGRCEGCRMQLTPADLAQALASPPDALVTCEECGRILVRDVETG